jgi:hypothetical protein
VPFYFCLFYRDSVAMSGFVTSATKFGKSPNVIVAVSSGTARLHGWIRHLLLSASGPPLHLDEREAVEKADTRLSAAG